MGISEDITDYKRTEEALNLARNKMALLNTVTFQDIQSAAFALTAYHELLKTVIGDEKGQTYLENQVSFNQKIIDSLNFAKNYQDMGIKPPRWQNVGNVFLLAISHLDFLHIARNISVVDLEIYADPLLELVFFHLMQNVLVHGVHATHVTIRYLEKPDRLTLVIEDNGAGIPAEEKHIIFDRGYGRNKGLGLFFVREVLSITKMTIKETGEAGKGARFEINVPKGLYRFKGMGNNYRKNNKCQNLVFYYTVPLRFGYWLYRAAGTEFHQLTFASPILQINRVDSLCPNIRQEKKMSDLVRKADVRRPFRTFATKSLM